MLQHGKLRNHGIHARFADVLREQDPWETSKPLESVFRHQLVDAVLRQRLEPVHILGTMFEGLRRWPLKVREEHQDRVYTVQTGRCHLPNTPDSGHDLGGTEQNECLSVVADVAKEKGEVLKVVGVQENIAGDSGIALE